MNARAIIVGEAWGKREEQMQHALVGPTGRETSLWLGQSGLAPYMTVPCRKCRQRPRYTGVPSRCEFCSEHIWPNEFDLIDYWRELRTQHQIHVTNVFNARPPSNDLGYFFGFEPETMMPSWKASKKSGGSHVKREFFFHIQRLWEEIKTLKPNLVIAAGNAACWATLGQTKITALRGTVQTSDWLDVKVLPMFHPAAILRNPVMRATSLADCTKAAREIEFPEIRRKERYFYIVDATEDGIRAGYEWFKVPARAYSNDIETLRNQISIVGFARSERDALIVPFRNPDATNWFPTRELEIAAWKLVIHGESTPQPKIFQNGLFDISHLCRIGIFPRNCLHDTMLWHHSEYPELPKSLGYLGSLYSDEIAWKILRTKASLKRDE